MKTNDPRKLLSLLEKVQIDSSVTKTNIADPVPFLNFIELAQNKRVTVDDFQVLQPWTITSLAALSNCDEHKLYLENFHIRGGSRFAFSLGLDDISDGHNVHGTPEKDRTVKLTRVKKYEDIEPVSKKIANLIVSDADSRSKNEYFDAEEVRNTLQYVIIELLRNVIQHSYDDNGGIILAQRMDKGTEPSIQVAVADTGIGILRSLSHTHREIITPEMALERSIWPSYSGTFTSYQKGSAQNAGMGLFFVSEIAKLTAGKLLLSSRGATLLIEGDPEAMGNNRVQQFSIGFPGTLAAFEIPKRGVSDYEQLVKRVIEIAAERQAKNEINRWVRYDIAPSHALEFIINVASENTVDAEAFSRDQLVPRIEAGQTIVLNFTNMKICTQSFMHALLFVALKRAFELKVPLYIKKASDSIKDGIRLVEMYGL